MSRHLSPAFANVSIVPFACGDRYDADSIAIGSRNTLARLLDATRGLHPVRTDVVHPCDGYSLMGATKARDAGMIEPVLIGSNAKVLSAAVEVGVGLGSVELGDAPHSHAAAEVAVNQVFG